MCQGLRIAPWRGIDIDGISAIRQAIRDDAGAVMVGEVSLESCWIAKLGAKQCDLEFIRACAA